jgi:NAD-dependent DNA ligase
MPLDDQRAQTTVKTVHWASSRTGNWIPRIEFEPVVIGTATISFCTGFHAQNIFENGIGPGATILIRRSGDVIPTLEKVLTPSPQGWQQPPEGVWAWDTNHVHATDTSVDILKNLLFLTPSYKMSVLFYCLKNGDPEYVMRLFFFCCF